MKRLLFGIGLVFLGFFPACVFAAAPKLGAVSPSNAVVAADSGIAFTAEYYDADGWTNIRSAYLHVNVSTDKTKSFYAYYNRSANKLYLRNDANTRWLGGFLPGANQIIENSYVKLDCSKTTISGSGSTLSINWSVSFKTNFLGQKKIYLYVQDNGGLKAGWTIKGTAAIIEPGTIVGPEGGEVVSEDEKVRLIVPAGSLSSARGIQIIPIDNKVIQEAVPSQQLLLNVVECKPYGLVFSIPAQLIYQLDQAGIPGTPVELGLYDSVQQKINPTGKKSVISADGYSVTFPVDHFSTYAALMNLVSQGEPIGGGVKIPLPDLLTGAFSHSFPITVPPGRKGMQPSISLVYRSSNANSWLGVGFDLKPGQIVRSTRLGVPAYDDTKDTFYLITDAGTTELVHLVDNLYQAKVESSFTRFYKEADGSWKALGKDGSVLRFGETDESREAGWRGIFSWYLTKAVDVNGNDVKYDYSKNSGKTYLMRVTYTGNENAGVVGKNTVDFILEDRADHIFSYISGTKIETAKRLKEIQAKCHGDLVWRYVIEYGKSNDTDRSQATSFRQCAGDGICFPSQIFEYQNNN
ncbi:MAG: SpvB/TcaC N-terminal domain-containing protein [Candidatus Marinimicrobia bacterium]|nr:SpvB/TcaC N-terminal domain-containing protein [Candidatus Neomarinimicrobiota bacterium]